MKSFYSAILAAFLLAAYFYSPAQNKPPAGSPKAEVYYFHPTERCPIDQSIESNTKTVLQGSFGKEMKEGKLVLRVLNTDDRANAKTVAKFDINTQALYIVKLENGKEIRTDLTEFAFSYSKSDPVKFRKRLQDEVSKALK
jgi:hypothetical protein